jgi:hypothetical protein
LTASVRVLAVVVAGVLVQYVPEVALAEDQHSVGEFGTGGEHEPSPRGRSPQRHG